MHYVFEHLPLMASIIFFSTLCYGSPYVALDQIDYSLFPIYISERGVSMTLSQFTSSPSLDHLW